MNKKILKYLKSFIKDDDIVLDLGCGDKRYSSLFKSITVDAWEKTNPDYLIDVEKVPLPFDKNSFDYVLMIDFIEHLNRERGKLLIEECKKIVRKKIFIYTPLIFNDNSINVNDPKCWAYNNPYDYHKSLWGQKDFDGWVELKTKSKHPSFFGYWQKNMDN